MKIQMKDKKWYSAKNEYSNIKKMDKPIFNLFLKVII